MGDFDFGQFKEIFDYLTAKLQEGGALTPEEQQVYDMLIGFSNQGLNLTGTEDFKSLYNAFNSLADEGTKAEFERLYGTNFTQDENGKIFFTRPGTIIEQFMRRGQSVNDGPAMAALSEGLQGYLKQIAQNKFASMTNSYAAMTPIRAQNIQAATNAGNLGSTAAARQVAIAGSAGSAAREGPGEAAGEGAGEPITIDTRGAGAAGGASSPSFMDKYGASLIGLLGTGALGIGGYLLKDWYDKKGKTPAKAEGDIIDRTAESPIQGSMGALRGADQYNYVPPVVTPDQSNLYMGQTQQPGGDQAAFNPYQGLSMNDYYGMGDQGWQTPMQQPYNYEDYSNFYQNPQSQPQQSYDWTQDWNSAPQDTSGGGGDWGGGNWYQEPTYDPYSWSGDTSSGYWV